VDDATGAVLAGEFREAEDAEGYLRLFHTITRTYGLPLAVYTDRHGIFHRDKRTPLTLAEQLAGKPHLTQVGRALQELAIRWIPAGSPQAKGRIENRFGTLQDRLVTELRLAGIADRAGANAFLPDFFARYNARFAQAAAQPEVAYLPWPVGRDPDTVWCFKYQRRVGNDNVVTVGAQRLQILSGPRGRSYAQLSVEVHVQLDGTLAAWYQGRRLAATPLSPPLSGPIRAQHHRRVSPHDPTRSRGERTPLLPQASRTRPGATQRQPSTTPGPQATPERQQRPWVPPADHPWRRDIRESIRKAKLRKAGVTLSRNS
jgi:hypothetical protein